MGKIVKFCSSCDEGFAEKFGFCPNCGKTLEAFEMNRVDAAAVPVQPQAAPPAPEEPEVIVRAQPVEAAPEPVIEEPVAEPDPEPEPIAATQPDPEPEKFVATPVAVTAPVYAQSTAVNADAVRGGTDGWVNVSSRGGDDDAFRVTVIEEKNAGQRNGLLLGSLGFMVVLLLSATVYSIFNKDLGVGSIGGDDLYLASLVEAVPTEIEEAPKPKLDKKDAGGGGGGGREEQEETTQGDLADQTPKPVRAPDAKVFRSDNFELKMPPPSTEGDRKFEKKFDRWGDPNGRFASFSNGTGSGGGQGSGVGTGQGSGRGTGAGSGIGSGSGGGLGSGNGNGRGAGNEDDTAGVPPPVKPVGVTQGLKILSKPRPGYTDAARTANVQGTVILRVTFLASGQIGSISPVKGLPNGLTEQAIAAARRISFEPQKVNGQGQTVTKQIEYSFSIY